MLIFFSEFIFFLVKRINKVLSIKLKTLMTSDSCFKSCYDISTKIFGHYKFQKQTDF